MEVVKREKWREGDRNEETEEELSPELPSLPLEIIREILLRLPARSIGRFRCVSKLFHSVLSNSGFAKSHLNLIFRNDVVGLDQRKLLVSSHNLYSVGFDSIANGCEGIGDLAAVELNYPLKDERSFFSEMIRKYVNDYLYCGVFEVGDEHPMMVNRDSKSYKRNWVEIVGSSNGLVCISPGEGSVFLYNPTTGESKRIPDVPESMSSKSIDDGEQLETFGFGFDDLTKDYKVVKLVANKNVLNASVYSLKTNLWRQIADLPYEHSDGFYTSGVYFNGSIHWVVTLQEGHHQRLVTAFDLKTEEFREMPLPNEAEDCSHRFRNFVVGNLNGNLCVVNSCYELHDDIWVMNEYGEPKSWSRIRINLMYRSMKPLCSTKNDGEFLLELDGDLILYNFKSDTSKMLEIHGVQLSDGFEAYTYVESVISPNSFHGLES